MKKRNRIVILMTGQQWIGLILLVVLVLGTLIAVKRLQPPPSTDVTWVNDSTKNTFAQYQSQQDSLRKAQWKRSYPRDTIAIYLQEFDPNTADSATLVHLGLKPWQAKNLIKYRAAGGKYRKAEDMQKLYGMTDSMFQVLRPYIRIAQDTIDSVARDSLPADSLPMRFPVKKDTVLNLRTADTTALKMIRGIGSYRARQIVRYREQLGGFVHIEQVLEAKGMEQIQADSLLSHFMIDSIQVEQMDINSVSVQRLSRHPYLRFEQAQAIYELRRKMIRIDSIQELEQLDCIPPETLKKIAPYIKFDKK